MRMVIIIIIIFNIRLLPLYQFDEGWGSAGTMIGGGVREHKGMLCLRGIYIRRTIRPIQTPLDYCYHYYYYEDYFYWTKVSRSRSRGHIVIGEPGRLRDVRVFFLPGKHHRDYPESQQQQ